MGCSPEKSAHCAALKPSVGPAYMTRFRYVEVNQAAVREMYRQVGELTRPSRRHGTLPSSDH
jgi:hypothetical protein